MSSVRPGTPKRRTSTRSTRRRTRLAPALAIVIVLGSLAGIAISRLGSAPKHTPMATPGTSTTRPAPIQEMEQPNWTAVTRNRGVIVVDRRAVTLHSGDVVTIYRFRAAQVRFALHAGSSDPPGVAAAVGPVGGSKISPAEAPFVVAAFNGGFKVASGSGGFKLNGRTFVPIRDGVASLVLDANGSAHVGVWGSDLPYPGEQVVSVRQNLQMLVTNSVLSSKINDLAAWGSTWGGVSAPARSALGEDASGNLLFAASMRALPADLGIALLRVGAVRAMQLDINPEWVQLASAPHPGAILVAGIPHQNRPGNQYSRGWTRDFITVLANR